MIGICYKEEKEKEKEKQKSIKTSHIELRLIKK